MGMGHELAIYKRRNTSGNDIRNAGQQALPHAVNMQEMLETARKAVRFMPLTKRCCIQRSLLRSPRLMQGCAYRY